MTEDTLQVRLAYGEQGLDVDLPAGRTTVVEPTYVAGAEDQAELLRTALRDPVAGPPLRELVRPGQTVAISMCDGTRPQPRHLMIPGRARGARGVVRLEDVVLLVATGTHRGNTDAELRQMLGDEVVDRVRVVNHDARDDSSLVYLGRHGADVPVFLNRAWVEADVRITTGFVEPHFFAGFSGGPKLVAPGLAGLETVLTLHDAKRIGDPRATWAVCEGNPVHDDIRAVVAAVGRRGLRPRRGAEPRAADRARPSAARCPRCTPRRARPRGGWRCSRCRRSSTSWSPRTPATRSTRTSTRR